MSIQSPFRIGRTLQEAADILNEQKDALVVRIPVVLSPQMEAFKDHIIATSMHFRQQPNAIHAAPKLLDDLLGQDQGLRACIPVGFTKYIPAIEGHQMLFESGAVIGKNLQGEPLTFDIAGAQHIKHIAIQGNEDGRTIPPKPHKDFGSLTYSFYMEGAKRIRYMVDGHSFCENGNQPSITVHRGYEHPLAAEDETRAAKHCGQIYLPNEKRASMHVTIADEEQLNPAQHPYYHPHLTRMLA